MVQGHLYRCPAVSGHSRAPAGGCGDASRRPHDTQPAIFLFKVVQIHCGGRLCNLYHRAKIEISGFAQPGIGVAMVLSAQINQKGVFRKTIMVFRMILTTGCSRTIISPEIGDMSPTGAKIDIHLG